MCLIPFHVIVLLCPHRSGVATRKAACGFAVEARSASKSLRISAWIHTYDKHGGETLEALDDAVAIGSQGNIRNIERHAWEFLPPYHKEHKFYAIHMYSRFETPSNFRPLHFFGREMWHDAILWDGRMTGASVCWIRVRRGDTVLLVDGKEMSVDNVAK
jgi:hypothetical protein